MAEKRRRQQILQQLARLESVERRWLGSVLSSLILATFMVAIVTGHLDLGNILSNQPIQIPVIQFLLLVAAAAAILTMNLRAFVDYFTLEIRVERAVEIRKRRVKQFPSVPEAEQ